MSAVPEPDGVHFRMFRANIQKSAGSVPVTYPTFWAFALPSVKDKQRRGPRRYVYIRPTLHTHTDRHTLRAVQITYP